ncbi:conjugal transfer protein TraG N-terminal domain-containing protein [Cellvibrio sp.]|uniref:conjugal transfer protein TraG N-terminal domain-containing protein n=1 Tax=Cellvibrio sp. TaxID=1965322 RepID=UPI0039648C6B
MATTAFDVITYGNGDFLRMVFNGVAALFGEDDYFIAMKTAVLSGFLVILFKAAFGRQMLANFTAFIGTIAFYMAVVVPKVDVQVVDRITGETFNVNNVPIGLGATASIFSITGDYLTKKFETIFSLPNGINYSQAGMLFPQSTLRSMQDLKISDPELRENMQKYLLNCVYFDGLGQNRFSPTDLIQSTDLMDFFEKNTSKNVTQFIYTEGGVPKAPVTCSKAITNYFKDKLNNKDQIKKMIAESGASFAGRSDFSDDAVVAAYKAKSETALKDQYSANQKFDSLAIQFGLINELQPVMERFGQEAGDLGYIFKKAKEERRLKNTTAFAEALWTLPKMRDLYEAFLYAIFPVVVLISLVMPSKVPVPYISMLVWINLWAPIYSIIHFAISYWTRISMANSGMNVGGFSALNGPQVAEHAADMANIAAWLAASTPVIAYMIVSRSGAMMAQLTTRAMQGYEQAAAKASDEIITGKGMYHGQGWQTAQTSANTGMTPGNSVSQGLNTSGSMITHAPDGHAYFQAAKSDFGSVSISSTQKDTETLKHSYNNAVKNEQERASELANANISALKAVSGAMHQLAASDSKESGVSGAQTRSDEKIFNTIKAAAEQWGKNQSVSQIKDYATQIAQKISASFGLGVGASGVGVNAGAGVSVENNYTRTDKESVSISDTEMNNFMKSSQFSEAIKSVGQHVLADASKSGLQYNNTTVDNLQRGLDKITQSQESFKMATKEAEEAKRELSNASEKSDIKQIDFAQRLLDKAGAGRVQEIVNGLNSEDPIRRDQANKALNELKIDAGVSRVAPANDNEFNAMLQQYRVTGSANIDRFANEARDRVDAADTTHINETGSVDYHAVAKLKRDVQQSHEEEKHNQRSVKNHVEVDGDELQPKVHKTSGAGVFKR